MSSRPVNRTTSVNDGKYIITQTTDPRYYKDENGKLHPIKLKWSPSKVKGEFLLKDNIYGVTLRSNSRTFLSLWSDGGKGLSVDYTLNKASFDGKLDKFSFDVLDIRDGEIQTKSMNIRCFNSKMYQFYKCPPKFKEFRLEYNLKLNNVIVNVPLKKKTKPVTNEDTIDVIDLGNKDGYWIFKENGTDALSTTFTKNKSNSHIDFYIASITDEFILQSNQYSLSEEFDDAKLDEYNSASIGWQGSSMYLKDTVICYFKSQNIKDFSTVFVNNLCNEYDLTVIHEDKVNGKYFVNSDNKKIGSYDYDSDGRFWMFYNTKSMPAKIKSKFKRKTFDDTSYLNVTRDQFIAMINKRFSYTEPPIVEDGTYYEQTKHGSYALKFGKTDYFIKTPILMDKNYGLVTTGSHSLKNNGDGTLTYTKYFNDEDSRLNKTKNIAYIDTNLYVAQDEAWPYVQTNDSTLYSVSGKEEADFDLWRTETTSDSSGLDTPNGTDSTITASAGDFSKRTTVVAQGYQGQVTTTISYKYKLYQTLYKFDTSGVSAALTSADFKCIGRCFVYGDTANMPTNGSGNNYIRITALKGTSASATPNSPLASADWNNFTGHTTSGSWGTTYEYFTAYEAEALYTIPNPTTGSHTIPMTSLAKTDITSNNEIYFIVMEHDQYYLDNWSFGSAYGVSQTTDHQSSRIWQIYHTDHPSTSYRPYIEVVAGSAAPTNDESLFMGANF